MKNKPYSPDIHVSKIEEQPTDTVSKISWASSSTPIFATSSWDSHIRIYQVNPENKSMAQKSCFNADSPCLSVNWRQDLTSVFAGCASGLIKEFDVQSGKGSEVGKHEKPVKDVYWLPETNTLCSVSFDQTVRFWDLRQSEHVAGIKLEYKPFCSDLFENRLVLGLAHSRVALVDVVEAQKAKDYQLPMKYMECELNKQPYSSIKFLPDGSEIVVSSDEGKCNISKLEDFIEIKKAWLRNVMVFKAHKEDKDGVQGQLLYPTNCIFTNKRYQGFLGTCGGDGKVTFWDLNKKEKICDLNIGVPVTYGQMSPDGSLFAFATGDDWSRGITGYMSKQARIYVHVMKENEIKKIKQK